MLVFVFVICSLFLTSCNVYTPLKSTNGDLDYIEEGTKCLHEDDYACAISHFEKISDPLERESRLCFATLSQASFKLSTSDVILAKQDDKVLGRLANELLPFSSDKESAIASAVSHCRSYRALPASGNGGVLTATFSLLAQCATLINKGHSSAGTIGAVIRSDVDSMPDADVVSCRADIVLIDATLLESAGVSGLFEGYGRIPDELKQNATGVSELRTALKTTIE